MDKLLNLKSTNEYLRMGKIFYTTQATYFYDTGTGKVIKLDANSKKLFETLYDESLSTLGLKEIINSIEDLTEITQFIKAEHLLSNPLATEFITAKAKVSSDTFKCGQLIIELTGNCNLRCKYCIYNDFYDGNRSFNTKNIEFETAKKAIDYVYAHRDPEKLAITFYGGEPLINFNVMRQCIDYCLENLRDVELSFSFTTNLTLMTEEIADYLARIPNLSILISMDGPEEIHDLARVKRNGQGSFKDAYAGLKILAAAVKKYNNTHLGFNAVLMPPYTSERFNRINNFFESLDFLPENTNVQATYPSLGSVPQSYFDDLNKMGIETTEDTISWATWAQEKGKLSDFTDSHQNLYTSVLETVLTRIHNRPLYDKPLGLFAHNGCCFPGKRRLYVCTDGTYKVCERIGNAPSIGNVDSGINIETITQLYLKEYEEQSLAECSKCWAINLCNVCYADCYDEHGINMEEKKKRCISARQSATEWLKYYHELMETRPEIISEISKIELA